MRGIAPAQIPGAEISGCHDVGGMFTAVDRISPCIAGSSGRR
jgi:hypothetical protein